MEKKMVKGGESSFHMPLHYPRYTQEDYNDMPEALLDRLLREYGLPAKGDLAFKRKFAMGAFLWPDYMSTTSHCNLSPSSSQNTKDSSIFKKRV